MTDAYTPTHRILVTLDDADFDRLPKTGKRGERMNFIREAIREKRERERLDRMYKKMNMDIMKGQSK